MRANHEKDNVHIVLMMKTGPTTYSSKVLYGYRAGQMEVPSRLSPETGGTFGQVPTGSCWHFWLWYAHCMLKLTMCDFRKKSGPGSGISFAQTPWFEAGWSARLTSPKKQPSMAGLRRHNDIKIDSFSRMSHIFSEVSINVPIIFINFP